MNNKLLILTGASGSGKTTLLNNLLELNSNFINAPKYSTRDYRGKGDDIINDKNLSILNYDLVYNLNKERYGIRFNEIKELLDKNKNVIIVLSNIRIIKSLKSKFKGSVLSIYVSSSIDQAKIFQIQFDRYKDKFKLTKEEIKKLDWQFKKLKSSINIKNWEELFKCMVELNSDWKKVLPMFESTEIRTTKIRDFHKSYLDNIHLYDYVVLNYKVNRKGNIGEDMTLQIKNILSNNKKNTISKISRLFVVIAASGVGKGELMQTIRFSLKPSKIKILSKEAKRDAKPNDKRDGLIAIGKDGKFSTDFNIPWFFHKSDKFDGIEYAISRNEIDTNFSNNIHQIVVSNFDQIDMFKGTFGNRVSFIYLHALRNDEDVKKYQFENNKTIEEAETRINEIQTVYENYVKRNNVFSHVLLNTTYLEDLYEQTFNLIEHYKI